MLALLGLIAGHPLPHAQAAGDPCVVSWNDAAGDTTYGLVYPVPVADDDLDATRVTVRATAKDLVFTVTVKRLTASGPAYGTGHGVGVFLTKYGRELVFSARKDATYGDRTRATGDTDAKRTPVRLSLDERTSTFTLTVARADVARLAGTPDRGEITGIGAFTLRNDQLGYAGDLTGSSSSVGTNADDAPSPNDAAKVSLDACDKRLRRR